MEHQHNILNICSNSNADVKKKIEKVNPEFYHSCHSSIDLILKKNNRIKSIEYIAKELDQLYYKYKIDIDLVNKFTNDLFCIKLINDKIFRSFIFLRGCLKDYNPYETIYRILSYCLGRNAYVVNTYMGACTVQQLEPIMAEFNIGDSNFNFSDIMDIDCILYENMMNILKRYGNSSMCFALLPIQYSVWLQAVICWENAGSLLLASRWDSACL